MVDSTKVLDVAAETIGEVLAVMRVTSPQLERIADRIAAALTPVEPAAMVEGGEVLFGIDAVVSDARAKLLPSATQATEVAALRSELADYVNASKHSADDLIAKDAEIATLRASLDEQCALLAAGVERELNFQLRAERAEVLRLLYRTRLDSCCEILDRAVYNMNDTMLRGEAEKFLTSFKYGDASLGGRP